MDVSAATEATAADPMRSKQVRNKTLPDVYRLTVAHCFGAAQRRRMQITVSFDSARSHSEWFGRLQGRTARDGPDHY